MAMHATTLPHRDFAGTPPGFPLLPLREKVPEGRMRGLCAASRSVPDRSAQPPHPALRATFSREGRRETRLWRGGAPFADLSSFSSPR